MFEEYLLRIKILYYFFVTVVTVCYTFAMDKIEEVLTRGVLNIIPNKEELADVLKSGKKLRLYNGIDPTGFHLHLGHMVVLRKLRQFQDLGHETIVLIGDFTARIGDPTDKLSTRYKLTKKQVEENAANYKKSISKILDLNKSNIRFLHNEKWTNKLKPEDMLELASNFTVSQLLERDMFQTRTKMGKEIYLHEFLYPMFQAYDSVTMDVDMEIGGNDQTFNMLAGRTLMKKLKNKEKFVLATKLLTDPTGRKMGKTEGNLITMDEAPTEIFGKIMAWPDEMIALGLELLTDVPMHEIQTIKIQKNPMEYKKQLAFEIVKQLDDANASQQALEDFEKTVQQGKKPSEIPTFKWVSANASGPSISHALFDTGLVGTISEGKRVTAQGGTAVNDQIITNPTAPYIPHEGDTLRVGKRKFVKIKV